MMDFRETNSIFTYTIDWSKCETWEDMRDIMSINKILIVDYAIVDEDTAEKVRKLEKRGFIKAG